jgi:hypothetical protein
MEGRKSEDEARRFDGFHSFLTRLNGDNFSRMGAALLVFVRIASQSNKGWLRQVRNTAAEIYFSWWKSRAYLGVMASIETSYTSALKMDSGYCRYQTWRLGAHLCSLISSNLHGWQGEIRLEHFRGPISMRRLFSQR